jgi:hypothetical protein
MSKIAPVVAVSLLLLACGGPAEPSSEAGATPLSASAAPAATDWTTYDIPFDASAAPYPPDGVPCFGHQFHFIGNWHVRQKAVAPPNGRDVRVVYSFTYDPPVFISETGAPWAIVEGGGVHDGVETYLPDGTVVGLLDKERIPLRNEATGERLTIWGKWHLTVNASGEAKVASFAITCSQP